MANKTWERIQRQPKGFKFHYKNSQWQSKKDFGCLTVHSALSIKPILPADGLWVKPTLHNMNDNWANEEKTLPAKYNEQLSQCFYLMQNKCTAVKLLCVQKAPLETLVFNKSSAGKCHKQKQRITPEVTHFPSSHTTAGSVITVSFLTDVCLICWWMLQAIIRQSLPALHLPCH